MDDPYENIINDYWDEIMIAYNAFEDKKPIIEFDIVSQKIYSYSGKDYTNKLSVRTRKSAKKQYKNACENNEIMIFVRDEENQKLRSYIYKIE